MGDMLVDDEMTPAMCRSHCDGKGNNYYATQVCCPFRDRVFGTRENDRAFFFLKFFRVPRPPCI